MARLSSKSLLVTAVVVIVLLFVFRGAGRWLIDAVGTLHGHGSAH